MADRAARMARMQAEAGNTGYEYRMIEAAELRDMLPGLGPSVVGASWTPYDGHANPLRLLHALHPPSSTAGGAYVPNAKVDGRSRRAARLRRRPPAAGASPRPASSSPPASAMPISRRASASPRRSARSAARCW